MTHDPPPHEVFDDAWVAAWVEELKGSDAYRRAAATWEGSLALAMNASPEDGLAEDRAVFLDLWHGDVRAARVAEGDDLDTADFVLRADAAVWKRVLDGDLQPIFGIMSGKLKLARGSVAKLTPYMAASNELVAAATRVPGRFPTAPV